MVTDLPKPPKISEPPKISDIKRILISVKDGRILHNGENVTVKYRRNLISVGCTDITPEDLEWILNDWKMEFDKVVQKQIEI